MAKRSTETSTEDLAREVAELRALVKQAEASGQIPVEIPGEFAFSGLETPEGQILSGKVKFKRGRITTVAFGARVKSASLIKVANGEQLTAQEAAESPALVSAGQQKCAALLTSWINKNVNSLDYFFDNQEPPSEQ